MQTKRSRLLPISIGFVFVLGAAFVSGCGGGSKPAQTRTTPILLDVAWSARTRTVSAPGSALSLVLRLTGANPNGGDFSWIINREADNSAHTSHFTSPTSANVGQFVLHIDFHSLADGGGNIVGTIDGTVSIGSSGSGIDGISTVGTISTVTVNPSQTVLALQSVQLTLSARDAANNLIAVTPGSASWLVVTGSDKLTLTQDGMATGQSPGTATVQAAVDGKTSSATAVTVLPSTANVHAIVFAAIPVGESSAQAFIADSDGSNVRQVTTAPTGVNYPTLSPDKTTILYELQDGLYTVGTDGSNPHRIVTFGASLLAADVASYSPDGTQIVFTSQESAQANTRICIATSSGANIHPITSASVSSQNGAFTPDGTHVVYEIGGGLNIIGADGSGDALFVSGTGLAMPLERPVFSSDGQKMTFFNDTPGNGTITVYVTNAAGNSLRTVPNAATGTGDPCFTSDSANILYAGPDGIYRIAADGSGKQKVISGNAMYTSLRFPRAR